MKMPTTETAGIGGSGVFKELLERLQDEYNQVQQQLHTARIELDKCQQERDSLQRYAMVYNETLFTLNMEMQKHMEIAKRLSGIMGHVIPMLPQEHQGSAIAAVERAKTIGPQDLQNLMNTHIQQQHLAAMMSSMTAPTGALNPAMMMAGMGLNLNIKPEEAMQAMFNNFLKNPMFGAAAGLPPPGMPSGLAPPGPAASLMPGPSSSSVPPNVEDAGRPATQPSRNSSTLNTSGLGGSHHGRPRSGTPSGIGTPNSTITKRAKLEPDEGDGELEIDVQNDDASSSAAPSHYNTNGRTSQPLKGGHAGKDMERDTASASSRDSATPRSGKQQLSSTPGSSTGGLTAGLGPLLPPTDANFANFLSVFGGGGRFPTNLNNQMSGLFGLAPPSSNNSIPPLAVALSNATTNGKSPSYAFKIAPGEPLTPVTFPTDASTGPDVPKSMKRIGDLNHRDVVCAVTIAKDGRHAFTGGKGTLKMWDISERIPMQNTIGSPSLDEIGGTGGLGEDLNNTNGSNGGEAVASSTDPWAPVTTFRCLDNCYIRSCKLFSDSSTLVVGGEHKSVCVLDVERNEVKANLNCDVEACYALAISPDCRLCYACCSNGIVLIWDLQSGERIAQLEGHQDGASCVDLSGDGLRLWTGGLDSTVRCWDIAERAEINKYTLDSQIFSLGCCPTDNWVAIGREDSNLEVLNTIGEEKYMLHGHQSCVLSLKFAHSGKWFVSTGKDNVVNCWRTPYGYKLVRTKEASSVLSCDISADDRYLLTGSGEKKASLYELSF